MNENEIEKLKNLRKVNSQRSYFWGKVLVVGLAGEVAVLLAFAEGKLWIETVIGVLTAVVVMISVGLELHFGQKADGASEELERISGEKIAEANARAEGANLKRVELEATIAPRTISSTLKTNEELKQFAGTKAVILLVADSEARRLARQIHFILNWAGWHVLGMICDEDEEHFMDQVTLLTKTAGRDGPPEYAAAILTYQLHDNQIAAVHYQTPPQGQPADWPSDVPEDAVLIRVGWKPQPYFTDKWMGEREKQMTADERETSQRMRQATGDANKKSRQYKEERRRRINEWMGKQKSREADNRE